VHDRRIDGKVHTFGNHGALWMNAMTWWDHETESIWSQPWGRALEGEYKGVELFLLPSQLTTWLNWRNAHPQTLVMSNDLDRVSLFGKQGFRPNFVIGLILNNQAKAYYYLDVEKQGIVHDWLNDVPILVWAAAEEINAFVRVMDDQVLTFEWNGETLIDVETGSTWNLSRGLALSGPLQGRSLQQVPSSSAFDWAWLDFYPESDIYSPPQD
jgi:hypothetical protein